MSYRGKDTAKVYAAAVESISQATPEVFIHCWATLVAKHQDLPLELITICYPRSVVVVSSFPPPPPLAGVSTRVGMVVVAVVGAGLRWWADNR